MNGKIRIRLIDVMVLLAIAGGVGYGMVMRPPSTESPSSAFMSEVDLTPLYATAVQADGRLRSFESHAKTYMGYIAGPRVVNGQSHGYSYLDLLFRPEAYTDTDIIFVKNKLVLGRILNVLEEDPRLDAGRLAAIRKSRLIAPSLLNEPEVKALLNVLGRDLIRTSKPVDMINSALFVSQPQFLGENLKLVAPDDATPETQWVSVMHIESMGGAPQDAAHAGMSGGSIPGVSTELQGNLAKAWSGLRNAWRSQDAATVNTHATTVAQLVRSSAAELYPSQSRLSMESWYFRYKGMTWVWLVYLASALPLLMAVIYKWKGARRLGIGLFVFAFLLQSASVGIRWYISGRWPNANMFEAVTTAAWFGGVGALLIEWFARKTPFRNVFALGSAVMSMIALMAAYYLPVYLDSSISNKMAALNDIWLYIHTNVIIWSYAVIGLACVPALLLLRQRWCLSWDNGSIPKWRLLILPIAIVALNYTAYAILMHFIAREKYGLQGYALYANVSALWASLIFVSLEGFAAAARTRAGVRPERSASGGASALMSSAPTSSRFLQPERPTTGQVFDGATMVLVEVAFIMLWAGTVMGAIWADHSWGRPWGWDPKEVFALNTFIIFLILLHVRLKVRDKAFHTAILAVVGFQVMLFNWIAVNFVITGLHSYA